MWSRGIMPPNGVSVSCILLTVPVVKDVVVVVNIADWRYQTALPCLPCCPWTVPARLLPAPGCPGFPPRSRPPAQSETGFPLPRRCFGLHGQRFLPSGFPDLRFGGSQRLHHLRQPQPPDPVCGPEPSCRR